MQLALPGLVPTIDRHALLLGRDDTPGIVSVSADRHGRARIWRRVDGHVVCEHDTYPNWFFLARRELLGDIPVVELPASVLEGKPAAPSGAVGLVCLRGDNAFQYLALTDHLDEVEAQVMENARRASDEEVTQEPLSGLVYLRPATEQYLTITGRTYFGGMTYADVRRLQFDLETTGLGFDQDRIFMVSVKDSEGYAALLDIGSMDEAGILRELARIIVERDPDIIENHNIFDFDIRFLIKRAGALGVPLPLGRDGSTFQESRDSVKVGAANQGFTRYSLEGREIVDTLQATRRFAAIQRDLRSSGLKEAARYFGVAADDREYVHGPEIWRTFQEDPDRVRRYCFDDVEEVDHISRLLLAPSFALASMVPKPYERIATAGTGQGLIEPLLLRAYLAAGHSLPLGRPGRPFEGGRTAVFTTGVVENVVKADVASLYPSIMLAERIGPASDDLGVFLDLLEQLTGLRLHHKGRSRAMDTSPETRTFHEAMQAAMKVLINSFYGVLGAGFAAFCDTDAAAHVASRGRDILQLLLDALRARGAVLVEADTDGVLFSLPARVHGENWTYEDELAVIEEVSRAMPPGIEVEHDGRYRAMYSYLEKNYALLDYEASAAAGFRSRDPVRLVGSAFRSARSEPLLELFLREALDRILRGEPGEVRALFRAYCGRLHRREVPTADLCVSMPLNKTPEKYGQSERREEPYEVYLAAGNTEWRSGHRVHYYQTRIGKKLLQPDTTDYDTDFYIERLRSTALQRLEKAFARADLQVLFSEFDGLFDPPLNEIRPLKVTYEEPIVWESADDTETRGQGDAETRGHADTETRGQADTEM